MTLNYELLSKATKLDPLPSDHVFRTLVSVYISDYYADVCGIDTSEQWYQEARKELKNLLPIEGDDFDKINEHIRSALSERAVERLYDIDEGEDEGYTVMHEVRDRPMSRERQAFFVGDIVSEVETGYLCLVTSVSSNSFSVDSVPGYKAPWKSAWFAPEELQLVRSYDYGLK